MKHIITFLMALCCVAASAQEAMVADTVVADALFEKNTITQHKWTEYEYVDTCITRYAVVHDWHGRCGIYDLDKHENLTELEYRELYFSEMKDLGEGNCAAVFSGRKGHRRGVVAVGPSGDAEAVFMTDEDMCYSLDSCRTIDKKLAKVCRKLLAKDMKSCNGWYGQVLVVETQTGHVKTWVALEDRQKNGKLENGLLYRHQLSADPMKALRAVKAMAETNTAWTDSVDTKSGCDSIGGMWVRDLTWYRGGFGKLTYLDAFKYHSNIAMLRAIEKSNPVSLEQEWWRVADSPRETDALEIARIYNVIALGGKHVVDTSVNTDARKIMAPYKLQGTDLSVIAMMQHYLKATLQDGGIGSAWTTKKVQLAGDYLVHRHCWPTIYDDNAQDMEKFCSEEGLSAYDQVVFVGYFPADDPEYTICVSLDKEEGSTFGHQISNTVNKISEYLNKH